MRKFEKSHPCVLSPDGFKQVLQKYAARHAKGDVVFALLSIRITNHGELSIEGGEAASLVIESLLRTCLSGLRQQDRACCLSDDFFLFLLPDADKAGAEQTRMRVRQILSQAKLKHNGKFFKPEGIVLFSHCGEAACDIDAMLHEVGATVDGHGELVQQDAEPPERVLARAKLSSWAQRYHGFTESNPDDTSKRENGDSAGEFRPASSDKWFATDSWSKSAVRIQKVVAASAPAWDETIKRARVLQAVDHPSLNKLMDFHCDDQLNAVFLVWKQRNGQQTLSEVLGRKDTLKSTDALRWIGEITSALAYLQQLVPPVVPTAFSSGNVVLDGQDIIIDGGLESYIFNAVTSKSAPSLFPEVAEVIEQIVHVSDSSTIPAELLELTAQLKAKDVPNNLNTMHKVRAAVRKIVERAEKEQQTQPSTNA